VAVRVLLFAQPEQLTGDAAVNYRIHTRARLPLRVLAERSLAAELVSQEFARADWIVDALFGTGLSGAVRPPFDQVIDAINTAPARVLAVDIPSGLDCDSGQPLGPTVRAEHTATFVAPKKGFAQAAAAAWLGQVHVLGIGAPRCLLDLVAGSSPAT
jgi:NAD(P)H-hydrate epimerase